MFSEPAKILEPFSGGAEHQEGLRGQGAQGLCFKFANWELLSPETFFFF